MRRFGRRTPHGSHGGAYVLQASQVVVVMSPNGDTHGAAGLLKEPLLQHLGQHERQGEGGCPHHQHPSSDEECQIEEVPPMLRHSGSSWAAVTTALLSLQLGWGLWLFPNDYARLGWCAHGILVLLAALTAYSGTLFTRLYEAVPGTVLFSDVGRRAAGELAARLVSLIVYSLDATRCVILHLAATQSLRHMFSPEDRPPLWQCGLVVFVGSSLLVQVRSMANMSWVFIAGTVSQLVAVGIVVMELVTNPNPEADTAIVAVKDSSQYSIAAVAVMNMVFAFGGQFAFTEIICNMKQPRHFSFAVSLCTVIMSLLYAGLGTIGYWSQGSAIQGIVIFSLPDSARARFAAGCILLQATAQYLINVNVWTHNVLVIIARRAASTTGSDHHEKLRCSTDHCRWRWLGVSTFVVGYSYIICISLPFFTTLVGLVTSVTYLACAYTLPAWFMLRLLGHKLWVGERLLLKLLIPASVLVSVIGLWGSVVALLNDLGSGEGWSSSHSSHGWAD